MGARAAFEIWAERALLDSSDDLGQLSRIMKEKQLGSLPLSIIGNLPELSVDNPMLEPLTKYLEVKDGVSGNFDRFLSRLFVLTPGSDVRVMQSLPSGIVVFTENGIIANGSADFVIRSGGEGQGKLSRQAEIESLGISITSVESQISEIDGALEHTRFEQEDKLSQVLALDEDIGLRNKAALDLMSELQSVKQNRDHIMELISDSEKMLEEHLNRDRDLVIELEELGEARISMGQEKEELNAETESLKEEFLRHRRS